MERLRLTDSDDIFSALTRLAKVRFPPRVLQLPWTCASSSRLADALSSLERRGTSLCWEVRLSEIQLTSKEMATQKTRDRSFCLRFDAPLREIPQTLLALLEPTLRYEVSLDGPWRKLATWQSLRPLFDTLGPATIHLEVPPWSESEPHRLTVSESFQLLEKLRICYPALDFTGIRQDVAAIETEPVTVHTRRHDDQEEIPLSVIIPSRGQSAFLPRVLRALERQTLEPSNYEVIFVEDGLDDQTLAAVEKFATEASPSFQWTYLRSERPSRLEGRLPLHRAGIVRNLGAEYARGRVLLFLDSDILVDQKFLGRVVEASPGADILQCPRWHIPERLSETATDAASIADSPQLFIEDEAYWGPFFRCSNWSSLPWFWKYTCTYCLAVNADLFRRIGFDRSLTTYGFEDTQFGYQAWRAGARFRLLQDRVYHLTGKERYKSGSLLRFRALSASAKHFYRNHLDPQIYRHFPYLMHGPLWPEKIYRRLIRSGLDRWRESAKISTAGS